MQQIGRYEILGELGRGGMGVVYLGRDPAIGRQVAIKTIRLQDLGDAEEKRWLEQRLLREARSAGILSHPYIVTVHDVAQEGDLAYIVMEYVKGATLERTLQEGEPPTREFVLNTLRQTAMALDYAHRNGIVHRDIKPSNILIHQDGLAKITDFGVAKIMTTQQMTRSGSILGTPNYMSPEQLAGKNVDGRADQFSLAGIAYLMLTGETPYTADTLPALVYKIVHEDPAAPQTLNPTLGAAVGAVFRQALARAPEGRYAACADFAQALEEALRSAPEWKPLSRRKLGTPRPEGRTPVSGVEEGAPTDTAGTTPVVCQACDARLPFGARFCLVCGKPVGAEAPTPVPKSGAPSPVRKRLVTSRTWEKELASEEGEEAEEPRWRWPVWAAVVVAMGMALGLVYWITSSGGSQQDRTAQVVAPQPAPAPPPQEVRPAPAEPPAPAAEQPAAKSAGKETAGTAPRREEREPAPQKVVKPYIPATARVEKKALPPPAAQVAPPVELPRAPQTTAVQQDTAPPANPPAPAPPPSTPVEAVKPAAGEIVWTGTLEQNDPLIIIGRTSSRGTMTGALPEMPVNVTITPATVRVDKYPYPGSVVLVNNGPRLTTMRIHWTAK